MDTTCIRMYCEFEGRCHGIVLVYFDEDQKSHILDKASELSKRHRITPDITIRKMDNYGEVFIEIFDDEYHHEDACFFEHLVEVLGAKLCECEELV